MTVVCYDSRGYKSKEMQFSSEWSLIDYMEHNSIFMSNWSIFKDDVATVYRLASDGSFRLFLNYDCNSNAPLCWYRDPSYWQQGIEWAD